MRPPESGSRRQSSQPSAGLAPVVEYVLGGDPTVQDAEEISPVASPVEGGLEFIYRRTDLSNNDGVTDIFVEYGSDLTGWTPADDGLNGVSIEVNDDLYGDGIDQVVVTLPFSLAVDGKIFARLKVIN